MLIPIDVVKQMCDFTKDELQAILRTSGYPETKLYSATCTGMNKDGQFTYETINIYGDGPAAETVYVRYIWNTDTLRFDFDANY